MSAPKNSPWGQIDHCETLSEGIYWVSTPGHGGLMIRSGAAKLSKAAKDLAGESFSTFDCFEEDCAWAVAAYELLSAGITVSANTSPADIKKTIMRWYPEYAAETGLTE
jgi:hypothetical protein